MTEDQHFQAKLFLNPLLCHHSSTIITNCSHSTTRLLSLVFLEFYPALKWNAIVNLIWIVPVNKLVSVTWHLWALRSLKDLYYTTIIRRKIDGQSFHQTQLTRTKIYTDTAKEVMTFEPIMIPYGQFKTTILQVFMCYACKHKSVVPGWTATAFDSSCLLLVLMQLLGQKTAKPKNQQTKFV